MPHNPGDLSQRSPSKHDFHQQTYTRSLFAVTAHDQTNEPPSAKAAFTHVSVVQNTVQLPNAEFIMAKYHIFPFSLTQFGF